MQFSLGYLTLALLCVQLVFAGTISVCNSCQYKSISKAIASLPNNAESYTVLIAPGTYTEQFTIARSNLVLKPASGTVTIQYASGHDPNAKTGSTADSAVLTITGKNVMMQDIIIANTLKQTRVANVALHVNAPQAYFKNVKIYGFQDTLLINRSGSAYFKNCWIEGSVDFIWGFGTGYFDKCVIASNQKGTSVTAQGNDSANAPGGFYFNHCVFKATVPSGPLSKTYNPSMAFTSPAQFPDSCYLGRPWRSYARVIIMNSDLGNHIKPAGWSEWPTSTPDTRNVLYGEYKNFGARPWTSARVKFSKNLSDNQAAQFTAKKVFGGNTSWFQNR
ncbi:pectin lyase-like protein [Rhizopus microsporus var. microsporus]|nr:pectin lyase-like protein [Rhizopus microsporus var. microsporus]